MKHFDYWSMKFLEDKNIIIVNNKIKFYNTHANIRCVYVNMCK